MNGYDLTEKSTNVDHVRERGNGLPTFLPSRVRVLENIFCSNEEHKRMTKEEAEKLGMGWRLALQTKRMPIR